MCGFTPQYIHITSADCCRTLGSFANRNRMRFVGVALPTPSYGGETALAARNSMQDRCGNRAAISHLPKFENHVLMQPHNLAKCVPKGRKNSQVSNWQQLPWMCLEKVVRDLL